MARIIPGEIHTRDLHQFLVASVAPRPIAFVSTVDEKGQPNLAPYSFFNVFSSNPPILVFSSNRRVVDNTTKDTLANIKSTRECVVNVVSYDIVRQMAVTSVQFDTGVNEFEKSGLTAQPSEFVKAFRVAESPVQMECKVRDIQALGDQGGAGHLIICDVVCMHIKDEIIDEKGRIDPHKIDLMGRLGRAYYTRAQGDAIHTIVQPVTKLVIGYDALPSLAKESDFLSANELGQLAGNYSLPDEAELNALRDDPDAQRVMEMNTDSFWDEIKNLLATDERVRALALIKLKESI